MTWYRGVHKKTGEFAMIRKLDRGLLLAQFNNIEHPHAYGWHLYFKRDFKIVWRADK